MAARVSNADTPVAEPLNDWADRDSATPPSSGMPEFRFSLRHLLAFFMGVTVMLAAVLTTDGRTGFALLLVVCIVAAHVVATALGSRLRAHADRRQDTERGAVCFGLGQSQTDAADSFEVAPQRRSPLHFRGGDRWPWLTRIVAAAMILGGICGGVILALSVGERASVGGVAIGALSFAVVSGWFAWLGGNFYSMFRNSWRDALEEPHVGKRR